MGIDYTFYNPNNGKEIDSGKYSGMPFFNKNADSYGIKRCAIRQDFTQYPSTIIEWTTDENSPLFENYFSAYSPWWTDYITRECAEKMQKDMAVNKTLFTDLMDENKCDALIMDVSY